MNGSGMWCNVGSAMWCLTDCQLEPLPNCSHTNVHSLTYVWPHQTSYISHAHAGAHEAAAVAEVRAQLAEAEVATLRGQLEDMGAQLAAVSEAKLEEKVTA